MLARNLPLPEHDNQHDRMVMAYNAPILVFVPRCPLASSQVGLSGDVEPRSTWRVTPHRAKLFLQGDGHRA